jgi:hypothetical protein
VVPLVTALWTAFVAIAVPLAVRVLGALGLGVATYTGVKALIDWALDFVKSNINALGADLLVYVAVFNVDRFFTIVFSAMVVRLVFVGLTSAGAITKMQWRSPGGGA